MSNINVPEFEKKTVEINETYIDKDGRTKERIKTTQLPTGRIEDDNQCNKLSDKCQ